MLGGTFWWWTEEELGHVQVDQLRRKREDRLNSLRITRIIGYSYIYTVHYILTSLLPPSFKSRGKSLDGDQPRQYHMIYVSS